LGVETKLPWYLGDKIPAHVFLALLISTISLLDGCIRYCKGVRDERYLKYGLLAFLYDGIRDFFRRLGKLKKP
jgi:hypothetical protein